MKRGSAWVMVAIVGVIAFAGGGISTAAWMLTAGGYRLARTASPAPSPTPSPSHQPTATPAISGFGARSDAALAFDAATGKMMLFGGLAGPADARGHLTGDTWSWDGKGWSNVPLTSGPVVRSGASMAYDAVHRVVVMRGGEGGGGFLDETWTWDGSRWLLMSPAQSPPVWQPNQSTWLYPTGEPLVWDSRRQAVELFAYTRYAGWSYDVPDLNQVWTWNGSSWTQLPTTGDAPFGHGRQPAGTAYDSARGSLVFFGHVNGVPKTWTLTGSVWTLASTSGPSGAAFSMTYDEARSQVVLFGEHGDTWTWDGTKWTAQNPVHSPGARGSAAMAYDSAHRVVMLVGGVSPADFTNGYSDTWIWDGSDWTKAA
jgi:hypothetical protein